jgi:hypothetical protein
VPQAAGTPIALSRAMDATSDPTDPFRLTPDQLHAAARTREYWAARHERALQLVEDADGAPAAQPADEPDQEGSPTE